jgi:hypothetical protein
MRVQAIFLDHRPFKTIDFDCRFDFGGDKCRRKGGAPLLLIHIFASSRNLAYQ